MIILNPEQKTKLTDVIKVMPVDDAIKTHWTQAVQAEKTP